MMKRTRTLAHLALLCGLAVTLSLLEGMFAPILPPGVKPGLSNIITMLAAVWYGIPAALTVAIFKALFALLVRGGIAFTMSISGGVASALATSLLLRFAGKHFGKIGISVIGAVLHNGAQLAVAVILMGTAALAYAPVLIVSGVAAGIVTGTILQVTFHVILSQVKRKEKILSRGDRNER